MHGDRLVRALSAVERACGESSSVVDLCRRVHHAIDEFVPVDRWCAFAVDPATILATNGYHDEGVEQRLLPRLLELEHAADDVNLFPALARTPAGVATISESTHGDLGSSARWREVLAPSGLAHELRAACRDGTTVWGAFVVMRGSDVADFDADESTFMERAAPTIARGFRRALVHQHIERGEDARESGIVILSGDALEVCTVSDTARGWLDLLDDGADAARLPTPIVSAAIAARAGVGLPATVRTRTRTGRWLTITAELLSRGNGVRDVGIVVQPSRPAEIAQIVAAAHGLTDREAEVVLLVASGRTNAEIARSLGVSTYTVADHLKNVFGKLDVASRGELTSKLFFDHHLPRTMAGSPAGGDGWYLGPAAS